MQVRSNARRSSLSSVAWGFAYPDLARTLPLLGSAVPQTLDRGWALENAWATTWKKQTGKYEPRTLARWQEAVDAGTRPAVIFNATISESGERFLIASTGMDSQGGRQFFGLFPAADLHVETAARLSATFPWVTPVSRAPEGAQHAEHMADGGYYDNFGVGAAIEWLSSVNAQERHLNDLVEKILFVQVRASKDERKAENHDAPWLYASFGPLLTMSNVRATSQRNHNDTELLGLKSVLATQGVSMETVSFELDQEAPLSWHLTDAEKAQFADIRKEYRPKIEKALEGLKGLLSDEQQKAYFELLKLAKRLYSRYNQFQLNLVRGQPNDWHCHAGSRYLYICENGLVHYCSQQRGHPGIPLEQYTKQDLEREYHTLKPCAPYCTVSCVHQTAMMDYVREKPFEAIPQFLPATHGAVQVLAWLFMKPATRRLFAKTALWILRVD